MYIVSVTGGWTPAEPSRQGRALLSCVDKAHTITLVLEFPRDGEGFPAAVLALVLVGRRANSRGDSDPDGKTSDPNDSNHGIKGSIGGVRVDHRESVRLTSHISPGSIRSDSYPI